MKAWWISLASRKAKISRNLMVAIAYLGMTLVMTYPLVFHMGDYFIGGGEDGSMSVWSLWWMKYALTTPGQGLFDCHFLFFPGGVNLTFHSMPKLLGAVFVLLNQVFSLGTAYNLLMILTFVTAGMAAYWLVLHLLGRALPAFLAGAFFAFCPYHLDHVSQMNLMSTMFIPLFILMIIRGREAIDGEGHSGWLWFALGGLFLGLTAYDTEHYAIFLVILAFLYALFYMSLRGSRTDWRKWSRLPAGLFLALLVAAVIFLPMLVAAFRLLEVSDDIVRVPVESLESYSADALAFFVPYRSSILLGASFESLTQNFLALETSYLGWVVIALAAAGAWMCRKVRETWFWVLAALVFAVISLGPVLYFNGNDMTLPMPFLLLNRLPLLGSIRVPARYVVMVSLALAVLAGYGADAIFNRLKHSGRARMAVPAAAVLILLIFTMEARPHTNLVSLDVPSVYAEIAASDIPGTVVSLPLGWETANAGMVGREATFVQLYQTVHLRPLVGGMVARAPQQLIDEASGAPVLRFLSDPSGVPSGQDLDPQAIDASMRKYQIAYIVVHKLYPLTLMDGRSVRHETLITTGELAEIDRYVTGILDMEKFEETEEVVAYRRHIN